MPLHIPLQDKSVTDEIDLAMRTPEQSKRYVEGRRIQTVFNLWDTDGNDKVTHYKLDRALCRRACGRRPHAGLFADWVGSDCDS